MEVIISLVIYALVAWALMYVAGIAIDMMGVGDNWSKQTRSIVTIAAGAGITWLMKGFIDDKIVSPLTTAIAG